MRNTMPLAWVGAGNVALLGCLRVKANYRRMKLRIIHVITHRRRAHRAPIVYPSIPINPKGVDTSASLIIIGPPPGHRLPYRYRLRDSYRTGVWKIMAGPLAKRTPAPGVGPDGLNKAGTKKENNGARPVTTWKNNEEISGSDWAHANSIARRRF
jgi:hypothetical protein